MSWKSSFPILIIDPEWCESGFGGQMIHALRSALEAEARAHQVLLATGAADRATMIQVHPEVSAIIISGDIDAGVGVLRRVIVHRPDLSLCRLTPGNREALLFDDVLCVKRAREEHDLFVDSLRKRGVTPGNLGVTLCDEVRCHLGAPGPPYWPSCCSAVWRGRKARFAAPA